MMAGCINLAGYKLISFDKIPSTQTYALNLVACGDARDRTVIMAAAQSAGRGRYQRTWVSHHGNLYASFIYLCEERDPRLSYVVAVAVAETLISFGIHPKIKWPNDIYWKEKKICGMLIENDLVSKYINQSIAGIGININQELFLSTVPNPVSLLQVCGIHCKRKHVLERILKHFESYYRMLERGEVETIREHYRKALFRRRDFHPYRDADGVFNARLHHVEDSGLIILEDTDGRLRPYAFKEVEFVL